MIDLKLETTYHDLDIANYDLVLVDGVDQVRQKLENRLQFFYGEWFLDNTKGVKLYETVFVKNPNLSLIASLFKSTILDTRDVNTILEYNQTYDASLRKLAIDFKVNTTYGIVETSVIV
jgi:hypothetical protein